MYNFALDILMMYLMALQTIETKKVGLFKRQKVVSASSFSTFSSKVFEVGMAIGASRPETGLALIASTSLIEYWTTEAAKEFVDLENPKLLIQESTTKYPWQAFIPPLFALQEISSYAYLTDYGIWHGDIPIDLILSKNVSDYMRSAFNKALLWGILQPDEIYIALSASKEGLLKSSAMAEELFGMQFPEQRMITPEELFKECDNLVNDYEAGVGNLLEIPQNLLLEPRISEMLRDLYD